MSFDGDHYHIYYAEDDDKEEMSEWEFDDLEITHTPSSDAQPDSAEFNKEGAVEQSTAAKTESSGKKRKIDRKRPSTALRVHEKAVPGEKSPSTDNSHGVVTEKRGTEVRPRDSVREDNTESTMQRPVDDEKVETKRSRRKTNQKSLTEVEGDTHILPSNATEENVPHPATEDAEASTKDRNVEISSACLNEKVGTAAGQEGRAKIPNCAQLAVDRSTDADPAPAPEPPARLPIGTCFVKVCALLWRCYVLSA